MGLLVYEKGDFVPDDGRWERCYPVPDQHIDYEALIYDRTIQRTAYIQANIVGVFNDWFKSFFPSNYFRTERIKTQSSFADFKSWMKGIYKKDKPILVIDPATVESMEDSLFGQNMLNRYNTIDPNSDGITGKMIYSRDLMRSDLFEMVYRRNRYRFEINVMIMEQTMDRAINTYNMMLMNMRHNSKFMLERMIPCMIPIKYIWNIAQFHGFDWESPEFLKFLNQICEYPVTKDKTPDGQTMFFFNLNMNVQVEVPGFPQKDSPEMNDAIEWGARVTDSFVFIADLPTEFLFLMPEKQMTKFDLGVPEDPDGVYIISPIYADMDWPKEINGYKLTNRADIMLDEGDKPEVNVLSLLKDYNADLHSYVSTFVQRGTPIGDLVLAQVYPNGSYDNIASSLSEDGTLQLNHPKPYKLYTLNLYINFGLMNTMKSEIVTKRIGTAIKEDNV